MKQLDLKRMMKLAAVKSGKDKSLSESLGGSVSLTQLECLPLEMQLQVANDEDISTTFRSPPATRKKRRRSPLSKSPSPPFKEASKRRSPSNEAHAESGTPVTKEAPLALPHQPTPLSKQPSFYQENIAPLQAFMDSNPEADKEAVEKVREFLLLCVSECRFSDVVKLLRSIKNRNDTWSGSAYQDIRAIVNEHVRKALGRPLDLQGLSL